MSIRQTMACDAKSTTVTGLLSFFCIDSAVTRFTCTLRQTSAAARTAATAALSSFS